MNAPGDKTKNGFTDRIPFPLFLLMGILTLVVFICVTVPADLALLVCLVRGPSAYFHDGLRIVGRPAHFTDGQPVPAGISFVVCFVSFLLTMWLVAGLLLAAKNLV